MTVELRFRAADLIGGKIRWGGVRLATIADIYLDAPVRQVVGFEVACDDRNPRFLPLAMCELGATEIAVGSPLALLEGSALAFYQERATAFRALRGTQVAGISSLGTIEDLVLAPDGTVSELVIERFRPAANGNGMRPGTAEVTAVNIDEHEIVPA